MTKLRGENLENESLYNTVPHFSTLLNMDFLASTMSDASQIVFSICYTLKLVVLDIDCKENSVLRSLK